MAAAANIRLFTGCRRSRGCYVHIIVCVVESTAAARLVVGGKLWRLRLVVVIVNWRLLLCGDSVLGLRLGAPTVVYLKI